MYNGFTEEERTKGGRIQTWAYSNDYLIRAKECSACAIKSDEGNNGQIIAHLEDYTEPILKAIFLCVRCHSMVHLRFDHPDKWADYIWDIANGYQYPHTISKMYLLSEKWSVNPTLVNDYRESTILDQIHSGELHPGPREVWGEKMDAIMRGEKVYWYPGKPDTLF